MNGSPFYMSASPHPQGFKNLIAPDFDVDVDASLHDTSQDNSSTSELLVSVSTKKTYSPPKETFPAQL